MQKDSSKVEGYEILSFEGVELTKIKGEYNSFMDIGTLLILYFQDSIRFILNMNDWSYSLLKRIPVTSSSRTNQKQRIYTLPAQDGLYILTVNKIPHPQALENFETILAHCTSFSYQGEEELSIPRGISTRNGISDSLEIAAYHQLSRQLATHERIKKSFARITDRIVRPFTKGYQDNINLITIKDFESLKNIDPRFLLKHQFCKKELENANLRGKALVFKQLPESTTKAIVAKKDIEFVKEDPEEIKKEKEILAEIERQKLLQDEAIKKQDQYRNQEYQSRLMERELYDLLQKELAEREMKENQYTEEVFHHEMIQREKVLRQQQELIDNDRKAHETRENELLREVNRKIAELKAKDKLSEKEHAEYARREQTLL